MVMDAAKEISVRGSTAENAGPTSDGLKELGPDLKSEFPFDPEWTNLNHGEQSSMA